MGILRDSFARLLTRRGRYASLLSIQEGTQAFTVEAALRNPTVLACVTTIAQGIGEVEFTAPDDTQVDGLLKRPNEWQTQADFLESVAAMVVSYGNAKVRLLRNEAGRIVRMAPHLSDEIETRATDAGLPMYVDRRTGERISGREIMVFRDLALPAISDISRLTALWPRIRALDAADRLIEDTFVNGLATSFLLKVKTEVGPEKKTEWNNNLRDQYGSEGKQRGGVVVLDGDADLTKAPMLKPADADLRELREHLIREIGASFGVPSFLIGGTSQVSYNNTSSRLAAMYRQTFSPLIDSIIRTLTMTMGTTIKANPEVLLRGDLASLTKDARELKLAGIITANEARKRIGEDPLDPNEHPDADKLMCSAGAAMDRGDRSGEMPSDDGTIGNPTPNDKERRVVLLPAA